MPVCTAVGLRAEESLFSRVAYPAVGGPRAPVFLVHRVAAELPAVMPAGGCPWEWGPSPLQEPWLCAPPQVVSGCLSGMVSVWEVVTGKRMTEFSMTGDQHVELTAMSLDESEACLLTGLRDGTMKMWNYSVGECLLTFPNLDQMEVSLVHQLGPGGPSQLL